MKPSIAISYGQYFPTPLVFSPLGDRYDTDVHQLRIVSSPVMTLAALRDWFMMAMATHANRHNCRQTEVMADRLTSIEATMGMDMFERPVVLTDPYVHARVSPYPDSSLHQCILVIGYGTIGRQLIRRTLASPDDSKK